MTNPFDTSTYPQTAPECVVKGRHVGWKATHDYDDADYTMKYVMSPIGSTDDADRIEVPGVRSLIDGVYYWVFEITTATSTAWTFDADTEYRWDLIVTRTSDNNDAAILDGFMRLFIANSDRRTHAEKMLAQIEALLEGKAMDDVSSYSIKSRSISKMTVEELLMWRDYYVNEVKRTGGSTSKGKRRPKPNSLLIGFA